MANVIVNGKETVEPTIASKYAQIYGLLMVSEISKALVGSNLFQLPWDDKNNISVSATCHTKCAVIIAIWEHDNRQDRFINMLQVDGWMLKNDIQISFRSIV